MWAGGRARNGTPRGTSAQATLETKWPARTRGAAIKGRVRPPPSTPAQCANETRFENLLVLGQAILQPPVTRFSVCTSRRACHRRSASRTVYTVSIFLHIRPPDVQPARCSVHRCCGHHNLRNWCRYWHRNCHISGKCIGCHLSSCRIRVPRRTLQRREKLNVPPLRFWTPPNISRLLHYTGRHDQHLVAAISDTDECSILPLGIQFRLSCASKSNRHKTQTFSKFNQLSAVQFASMQLVSCASITTNLIHRHQSSSVFHEKRQDGCLEGTSHFTLSSNALFITLTCVFVFHAPRLQLCRLIDALQQDSPPSQTQPWASTLERPA